VVNLQDVAPPAAVLSAPSSGSSGLSLTTTLTMSWAAGVNGGELSSYQVQVSTVDNTFGATVYSWTGLTTTSQAFPANLTAGTNYYWRVGEVGPGGGPTWAIGWSFSALSNPPVSPSLSTPGNNSPNEPVVNISLSWQTVSGATSYSVQISSNSGSTYYTPSGGSGIAGHSLLLAGPLANGITYYWQVEATNGAGSSSWTTAWTFTTIAAGPPQSAPVLSAPLPNAQNEPLALTCSWGAVTGANSYQLYVSTTSGFSNTLIYQTGIVPTSYVIGGLSPGVTYYWQVDANNSYGNVMSALDSFVTVALPGAPGISSPLVGAIGQATSLSLSWSAPVSGGPFSTYGLQVSTSSGFGTTLTSQAGFTGTSVALSSLLNGTTYYWQVNAAGPGGTGSWAGANFATLGVPALSSPTTASPNQPLTALSLNWGSVAGAATYALEVSTSSTSFANSVFSQTGITGTYGVVGGLTNATTYYWQVSATAGGYTTPWSTIWNFVTVPLPPAQPTLAEPENGFMSIPLQPNLTWNTLATATSYEVELSSSAGFSSTLYDTAGLTGTSYTPPSVLANNSLYYWQVRATNAGGTGNWATARSFTTAENYSGWTYHKTIPLNTAATGWTTAGQIETNFPVLVRLNSTNFSGFNQVNYQSGVGRAIDIRFSGTNYAKSFPYQVDSWSSAGDSANIWVLVDTLFSNTTKNIVMHYGNGSAADMSSGAQVFDTGNGYQAVYHFSEATAGNATDATINGLNGTNEGAPAVIPGVIGSARSFNGTSQYFYMNNSIGPSGKVCFPAQGYYTLSAWINSTWTTGQTGGTPAIIGKGTGGAAQYHLYERGTAGTPTGYEYSFLEQRVGSNAAQSKRTVAGATGTPQNAWIHIVGVRNGPTTPMAIYVNGVNAGTGSDSVNTGGTRDTTENLTIGAMLNATGIPTTGTCFWEGNIDEPEVSSVSRDANWALLAYQNQRPTGQTLVQFGTLPLTATLVSPSNGLTGISLSPTLSWTAGTGDTAYEVQVATSTVFGSPMFYDQTGIMGTSQAISGLAYGQKYYWRVDGINNTGYIWSAIDSFTTEVAPPAAPMLASPTNGSTNEALSLALSWNTVATATSYDLQVSTTSVFGSTVSDQPGLVGLTSTVGGLAYQTTYFWRVDASNSTGTGAWSDTLSFMTMAANPSVPSLALPANNAQSEPTSLTLSWKSEVNVSTYAVQVSTSSGFGSTVTAQIGLTTTSASITGLSTFSNFYWRVGAKNVSGVSGWSNAWSFGTGSHFSINYPLTDNNMMVSIPTAIVPTKNGAPLQTNDEIAVFNHTGLCVGALVWQDTNASMTVWGQDYLDDTTVDGMGTNEVMQFRIWDAANSKDMKAPATYVAPGTNPDAKDDSLYVAGGISVLASLTGISAPASVPVLTSPTNTAGNVSITPTLSWTGVPTATSYCVGISTTSAFSSTVYFQGSLTGTSQAVNGLVNSATYYWRAGAKNAGGVSGWSSVWNFTTVIGAPAPSPTLTMPKNDSLNAPTSLVLSWTSVTNAATYAVQVATVSSFASTVTAQIGLTVTSATIGPLANSTTYYWRAGAKDAGGVSGWSAPDSFTTIVAAPSPYPTLTAPKNDSLNAPTSLVLSWTTSMNAATYAVQVSTVSSFASTVTAQIGLTTTSATIGPLTNSTTYYWRAGAKDIGGVSGWSAPDSFTTIVALPGTPTLAYPKNDSLNAPTSLTLSWNSSSNAATYAVQVSAVSGFGTTVTAQIGLTATSASIGSLAYGTTYYWRVGAKDAAGVSGWSAPDSFTTVAGAPAVPTLTMPKNDSLNAPTSLVLSWTSMANAATYAVQVSTVSGFGSTVTAQFGLTGTSAAISNLANSTTYYWRAGAKDPTGVSGWSAPDSFTTIVALPGTPTLAYPKNDSLNAPTSLTLSWNSSSNAATYAVQVSTVSGFGSTVTAQFGLIGTSAAISGLANSATYYWRTGAKDFAGVSGWSAPDSFTTIVALPGIPTLAYPKNDSLNAPTSLTLSWNSSSNAATYAVQVSTVSGFGSTVTAQFGLTGTSAAISGLANSATYYWRTGAADLAGVSGWSAPDSFTTIVALPGIPMLAYPKNDSLNAPTSLTLSWNTSSYAATYAVQVSTVSDFGSTVTAQFGLTGTSAAIGSLANSATYYWRTGAKNLAGVSGWSNPDSFVTVIAAPGIPALAYPKNDSLNAPTSLTLSWNTSVNAATYAVQVSTAVGFGSTVTAQFGLTGTSAAIGTLANSATYYWRVGAKDLGGVSGWSAPDSFVTVVAAPVAPLLSMPANGVLAQPLTLTLGWNGSQNATGYAVQVSTSATFSTTLSSQAGITGTTLAVSGLASGITYYWEVEASDLGGSSPWSSVWTFTTQVNFTLPIDAGWNIVSLNIRPADSNASAVFGDALTVAAQNNFILVKTLGGKVYMPTLGISDSIVVQTGVGYQVYVNNADTVRTVGSAIAAFSTPIWLKQGWSLLGYLPPATEPIGTALSVISSEIMLMKDNAGDIYWPDYGIDNIDTLCVGQGYFTYMKDSMSLTYSGVAKRVATASLLSLPKTHHYAKHANTGNNASVLATRVTFGNSPAPDSCEIGAYDASGNLVGSGTVIHGLVAFPVWGQNAQTKQKDGLSASEKIGFKLWNKNKEYPVEFKTSDGSEVGYSAQAVFLGSLAVPEAALITEFSLAKVYPNPFRGVVQVAFDVPMTGVAQHSVEINIFNMKGILVHQLARGKYAAGHYVVSWSGESMGGVASGAGIYVIQMKADNFDKRMKLVRVQ
jgi:hypothetical protein